MNKLIIIRGPSGAGKSTVSRELFRRTKRPTLLVSEDAVRKMFSDHHTPGHKTSKILATVAVRTGLENGYDVIYEGILNTRTSGSNLKEILNSGKAEGYLFYLDISWEETVARHSQRPEKADFNPEAMKKWWGYAAPTGLANEVIIPETSSLEHTLQKISQTADLALE